MHQSPPFLQFLSSSHRVSQFPACPLSDIVIQSLLLSSSFSPSFGGALQNGLGQSLASCYMTILLYFPFLYSGKKVIVMANFLADHCTYLFVGYTVFVANA